MRDVIVLAIVAGLAACAMPPATLPASHPAAPKAQAGRLAGAPPALRPGVVKYPDVPAVRKGPPPAHHHHGH